MSSAPAWVSYAALGLSSLSLGVAFLSYRAGAPRLRLEAARDGANVTLTVVNAGRAAVTIQDFHVAPYGGRKAVLDVDVDRPALPYRLEAHETQTWATDALAAARKYDELDLKPKSTWPSHFQFTVAAGNGKSARARRQFDAVRIIADANP